MTYTSLPLVVAMQNARNEPSRATAIDRTAKSVDGGATMSCTLLSATEKTKPPVPCAICPPICIMPLAAKTNPEPSSVHEAGLRFGSSDCMALLTSSTGASPPNGWKKMPSSADDRQTAWLARKPLPKGSGATLLTILHLSRVTAGDGIPPAAETDQVAVPPLRPPLAIVKPPMLKRICEPSAVHAGSSTREIEPPRRHLCVDVSHNPRP